VLGLIRGVNGESGSRDEVGITIVFGIGLFYDFSPRYGFDEECEWLDWCC
jgi:hypothetical protein